MVYEDAPPRTRGAADELAAYIERISGARPDVIEGVPDPIPPHAIWVGVQPAVRKFFPEIDFDFEHRFPVPAGAPTAEFPGSGAGAAPCT